MIILNKAYIKFSSVTHAMRAKEIIEKYGYNIVIKRNTNNIKKEGCGYILLVKGDTDNLINLLKINQIKYIGYDFL